MKAVIIDDERLAVEELSRLLELNPSIEDYEGFIDGKAGLKFIIDQEPDIAFVDINMPLVNGTVIAGEIKGRHLKTRVIFVTAYDDYAVEAFQLEVYDYILKPISQHRINRSIRRVEEHFSLTREVKVKDTSHKKRFAAWVQGSIKLISTEEIIYFEVENKKTMVIIDQGRYEMTETLTTLYDQLNHQHFCQCYKGIVVNLNYVDRISPMFNKTYELWMKGVAHPLPVSRHYGSRMRELLGF